MSLIQRIHNCGARLVIAVTGGGSGAISSLLDVPGASRSVIEARVPYAPAALSDWLGSQPEQFCSQRTARAMAMVAYLRGRLLEPDQPAVVGVACTASLASDRPKHGPHRAHLALQTGAVTGAVSIELAKGRRSRAEEEEVVASLILNLIAQEVAINERMTPSLFGEERVEAARAVAPPEWQALLAGRQSIVRAGKAAAQSKPATVFPGAFNPLHRGHIRMAEIAAELLHAPVAFELSILNVDKPPLDFLEIEQRAGLFRDDQELWLTRAPTFVEKAACFPGATFVVGVDTLVRIADPRYYAGSPGAAAAAIEKITAQDCRFLVFGRLSNGQFQTLADLDLPETLRQICQEVPQNVFREDVSSTDLRQRSATEQP